MTMRMALDTETMTQHASPERGPAPWQQWAWPACATVLVHGLALATLMLNWAPVKPAAPPVPSSISLTMISAPVPAVPMPVPEALPPMPESVVEAPPVAEPVIDTPPPEPVIDHAAIAREKRAMEQERERVKERERQQKQQALERQQHEEREQEQQRQAAQAEQARQAAAQQAHAQAQAEQISQYQPLNKTAPDYPRRALDLGVEGDCTVQYDVMPNGRVSKPSVVGCDDPLFERPSLRAAAGFRYEPHRVNGQAVTVPGVRNTFRYRIGAE